MRIASLFEGERVMRRKDSFYLGYEDTNPFHTGCGCSGACLHGKEIFTYNSDGFDGVAAAAQLGTIAAELGTIQLDATIELPSDFTIPGALGDGDDNALGDLEGLFFVQAGETVSFAYRGTETGGIEDPYLVLYQVNIETGALTYLTEDDDGGAGRTSLISFTATEDMYLATLLSSWFLVDPTAPRDTDDGDYTLDVWFAEAGTDDVGDDFDTAAVLTEGETHFGTIETSDDYDMFSLEVQGGRYYTVSLSGGVASGADYDSVGNELVAYLDLYDSSGNLIGSGLNYETSISFFAEEGGTYYIGVEAFLGITAFDNKGGFTLDVSSVLPTEISPLDAILWDSAANIPTVDVDGVPTAYVYFGDSDENFGELGDDGEPMITIDWNAFEKQQMMKALDEYTDLLGINYVVTDNSEEATFRLLKTESAEYGAYFIPQDPSYGDRMGIGVFNVLSGAWNRDEQQSLLEGGFAYGVILHELGHAHGLSHPHDNGGGSSQMLGVLASDDLGIYNLNQGVYTVMSYNDAWQTHPDGPTPYSLAHIDSGWSGGLGAFDLAALDVRYGLVDRNTGNTTYVLQDTDDVGAYYEAIWDTGGTDEIVYSGSKDAQIDLLAATIDYTPTGGGVVSFVDGVWGGYTIAQGVVIENATGGNGDDVILGNSSNNVLTGNGGDDFFAGRGGNDTFNGGAGYDTVSYIDASEGIRTVGTVGVAGEARGDRMISIEHIVGTNFDDVMSSAGGTPELSGAGGNDTLSGLFGNDVLNGGDGNDTLTGNNGEDELNGDAGDDFLYGGNGKDVLNGGSGSDLLNGGNGKDTYVFDSLDGVDTIVNLEKNEVIDLSAIDAIAGTEENDGFTWLGSSAFTGTAGELRYQQSGSDYLIEGDVDGDGLADLTIIIDQGMPTNAEILFG